MKRGDENIAYYNAIATEYDDMLEKNPDKIIREKVADKFCSLVKNAAVLDFGGGTGLDLEWLSSHNNAIFFCEPSTSMREKAISNHKGPQYDKVIFLDDANADFTQWPSRLPFDAKVDAVLSNFAVLNCIPRIKLLFRNLAMVVKPGGNMIALVLTKNITTQGVGFNNILKTLVPNKPAIMRVDYKKHRQTVYLYSIKEIIKSSSQYFDFCSNEILTGTTFTLIHLKRK